MCLLVTERKKSLNQLHFLYAKYNFVLFHFKVKNDSYMVTDIVKFPVLNIRNLCHYPISKHNKDSTIIEHINYASVNAGLTLIGCWTE